MSKILVAYYSAQGHTKRAAKIVAERLGADLFELRPTKPYEESDFDWANLESRVSKERANEELQDVDLVQEVPDNWDSYDIVLIGYPLWYAIPAWPINRFIKINSFIGKIVVPFCTSHSSPLSDSDKMLHRMTSTGDWRPGIRFYQDVPEEELASWAEGLGF